MPKFIELTRRAPHESEGKKVLINVGKIVVVTDRCHMDGTFCSVSIGVGFVDVEESYDAIKSLLRRAVEGEPCKNE